MVILHISDLHFGVPTPPAETVARQLALGSLGEHLAKIEAEWRPTAVLVGGDLAWSGSRDEFDLCGEWLDALLRRLDVPKTVPALVRLHSRHLTAITIHNTFDEALDVEAAEFGNLFSALQASRPGTRMSKTALEVALETFDVTTTVNRGFSYGLRTELLHTAVMAAHLRRLVSRVVGINNAAFSPLDEDLVALKEHLWRDRATGAATLFEKKQMALRRLPEEIRVKAAGKVVVVSMGRRVAQKQHDVLVESVREILRRDPACPLLAIFATVDGDSGSAPRLERMERLRNEFPSNVVVIVDRVSYYRDLMMAADYNVMPSLLEPHGRVRSRRSPDRACGRRSGRADLRVASGR